MTNGRWGLAAALCLLLTVSAQPANGQGAEAQAGELLRQLEASGRVVIEGIEFEPKASDILPRSEPALKLIAQMLELDPELELVIVGHTDNQGSLAQNVDLSRKRAMAVLNTLVRKHKVRASRLQSWGAGSLAPLASNDTKKGRARNRRIELVEP